MKSIKGEDKIKRNKKEEGFKEKLAKKNQKEENNFKRKKRISIILRRPKKMRIKLRGTEKGKRI